MGKKKKQKKKPINWQELAISAVIDLINILGGATTVITVMFSAFC